MRVCLEKLIFHILKSVLPNILQYVLPNKFLKKCPSEHDVMCPSEHDAMCPSKHELEGFQVLKISVRDFFTVYHLWIPLYFWKTQN